MLTPAHAELVFEVAAGAFTPAPKVESAVLRIVPRADPLVAADDEERYRAMVVGAFGFRRKQMQRVIRELWGLGAVDAAELLATAAIDPAARPEVLGAGRFCPAPPREARLRTRASPRRQLRDLLALSHPH